MRLGRSRLGYRRPFSWKSIDGSENKYRWIARTPNWDDDSEVYEHLKKLLEGDMKAQMYLGLHDRGIDPTKTDNDALRGVIAGNGDE